MVPPSIAIFDVGVHGLLFNFCLQLMLRMKTNVFILFCSKNCLMFIFCQMLLVTFYMWDSCKYHCDMSLCTLLAKRFSWFIAFRLFAFCVSVVAFLQQKVFV